MSEGNRYGCRNQSEAVMRYLFLLLALSGCESVLVASDAAIAITGLIVR